MYITVDPASAAFCSHSSQSLERILREQSICPAALIGVSLENGKFCTASLFFEQATLSQHGVLPRYTLFSIDFV